MDLDDLLNQAEQLTATIAGDEELPRVEKNLQQILDGSGELWSKSVRSAGGDVRTSAVLGAKGVDLPALQQRVESLSGDLKLQPVQSIDSTNLDEFLRSERENLILSLIENTTANVAENSRKLHWESVHKQWEEEKQTLVTTLLAQHQLPSVRKTPLRVAPTPGPVGLDDLEMRFWRAIARFSEEGSSSLLSLYKNVSAGDRDLEDFWEMIDAMIDSNTNEDIISNARQYLEKRYRRYLMISGGGPSTLSVIESYLRSQPPMVNYDDGLVSGCPVWAVVWNCLRVGDSASAFSKGREVLQSSSSNVRLQYHREVCRSKDPFKRAVFSCLGKCDVQDPHEAVCTTLDDYIWLRLCQIGNEGLTLETLQNELSEQRERLGQQPLLFFSALWLTGQWESAIDWASQHYRLRCHAVHLALLMKSKLNTMTLVRHVRVYTRRWESNCPVEALAYYSFLEKEEFILATVDLAIETRKVDLILSHSKKYPGGGNELAEALGHACQKRGLLQEAAYCFERAGCWNFALPLLIRLVSGVVDVEVSERRKQVLERVTESAKSCQVGPAELVRTLYLLMDLATFYDASRERPDEAIDIIRSLRIIPLESPDVDHCVNSLKLLSEDVKQLLPNVLITVMTLMTKKYKTLRSSGSSTGIHNNATQIAISKLRAQAKVITTFVGRIPYRMPGNTNSKLAQLELLMT